MRGSRPAHRRNPRRAAVVMEDASPVDGMQRGSMRRRPTPGMSPPRSESAGTTGITVDVVDRQRAVRIGTSWLTRVVRAALARQGVERAQLCVLLVGDRRMAALHDRWLGLPGTTDVISFDLSGGMADGLTGDIAISTETARRVARQVGWSARLEVAYYAIHGLLHLAGYDDHDPAERRVMRLRERALLAAAGLPPPPHSGRISR